MTGCELKWGESSAHRQVDVGTVLDEESDREHPGAWLWAPSPRRRPRLFAGERGSRSRAQGPWGGLEEDPALKLGGTGCSRKAGLGLGPIGWEPCVIIWSASTSSIEATWPGGGSWTTPATSSPQRAGSDASCTLWALGRPTIERAETTDPGQREPLEWLIRLARGMHLFP